MAWIVPIATALYGAYSAKQQANKRSKPEQQAAQQLGQNSQLAGQYGKDLLGKSQSALNPVYDYFSNLATGDRQALMQYLSPEILAQSQGARRAFQTGSELAPRSGLGTETVSRIPTDNSASLAHILQGARPAGIQGLATLGTNWGSLGMSGLGQANSGASGVIGYEQNRRQQQQQAGMDTGSSVYELFKLFQDMRNPNKGTGSTGTGTGTGSFWSTYGKAGG